jgi:hypothetical protein
MGPSQQKQPAITHQQDVDHDGKTIALHASSPISSLNGLPERQPDG